MVTFFLWGPSLFRVVLDPVLPTSQLDHFWMSQAFILLYSSSEKKENRNFQALHKIIFLESIGTPTLCVYDQYGLLQNCGMLVVGKGYPELASRFLFSSIPVTQYVRLPVSLNGLPSSIQITGHQLHNRAP